MNISGIRMSHHNMKSKFFCLLALAAFTSSARAQNPVPAQESALSPKRYLLVTAGKDSIYVEDCEVTKEKEGMFIKFAPVPGRPDLVRKPIPVLVLSDRVQFSIGTGDWEPQSREHAVFADSVYVGQLSHGEIHGTITEVRASPNSVSLSPEIVTEQFCLHPL